mmetsp:Transcript_107935/g.232521  ORF Transcript_107935/g.232521 Transcript_107935/m.232521 type:complete len:363 (-) Transcript_107935:27-1115(-)
MNDLRVVLCTEDSNKEGLVGTLRQRGGKQLLHKQLALVVNGSRQQRGLGDVTVHEGEQRLLGQLATLLDQRGPGHEVDEQVVEVQLGGIVLRLQDLLGGLGLGAGDVVGRAAHVLHHVVGVLLGRVAVVAGKAQRVALLDHLGEEAFAARHGHVGTNTHATSALSTNGHVIRVTTESLDVVAGPLHGFALVHEAVVALHGGRRHEAEGAQSVVDGDGDHVLEREVGAVVQGAVAEALLEGTTVDPQKDGVAFCRGRGGGSPHGEIQAVLADTILGAVSRRKLALLHAAGGHEISLVNVRPGNGALGVLPSELAHRGCSIRDTAPLLYANIVVVALHKSGGGRNQQLLVSSINRSRQQGAAHK